MPCGGREAVGPMGRRPTTLVGRSHVDPKPTSPLVGWLTRGPSSREECMPSFLLMHGCYVGPLILVLASDWSRGVCLGLLMWHCAWAGSPPLVWLPSGPLCLAWGFMSWIICMLHAVLAQIHLHTFSDQHLWNSSNNHPMLTFIPSDAQLLNDS